MPGSKLEFLIHASAEPQPWVTVYNGIEYPGEVIAGDAWTPVGESAWSAIRFSALCF